MIVRRKEQNLNKERMISLPVQVVVPIAARNSIGIPPTFSLYPVTVNRSKV